MRKTASRRVLSSLLGKGFFSVVVAGSFTLGAEATTYYVSTNEVAEGVMRDGLSLQTAFAHVRDAVDQATQNGDVIEIGEGVYEITQRIVIDKPITLRGTTNAAGEPISEIKNITLSSTQTAPAKAQVLRLSNNCRVESLVLSDGYLQVTGDSEKDTYRGSVLQMNDAVVTNCVIQGGRGRGGNGGDGNNNQHSVGVFMEGTKEDGMYLSRLENCIVRNNFNRQGNQKYTGGGVHIKGYGLVSNCVIANNVSHGAGGGVAVSEDSDGLFVNCVITGNYGGYCLKNDSADGACVASNEIATDQANAGGAGGAWRGTFVNCLIADNHSQRGSQKGGWSTDFRIQPGTVADATLYGCTVVSNKWDNRFKGWPSDSTYHAGLFKCTAYNTLVWGNTVFKSATNGEGSQSTHNWESRCTLDTCWTTPTGTGVALTDDPAFTNYTLSAAWPIKDFTYAFAPNPAEGVDFLNKGLNDNAKLDLSAVDLDDQPRCLDDRIDIGCLETKSLVEIFTPDVTERGRTHKSVYCTLDIKGNSKGTVVYTLEVSKNDSFSPLAESQALTQNGNGTLRFEVGGLEVGTDYHVRLVKDGEDTAPLAPWTVTTHSRSIHVVDDLTVDDGDDDTGITVRIDEIFSGSVTATVTVDGKYTKTATFTASDAPALITITKNECDYTASSTVDAVFTATDDDGTVYAPLVLETGRQLFVNPGLVGDDANAGKYWAKPKKTIQSALEALKGSSCANITTIVLQEGNYTQEFGMGAIEITKPVTVVGEGEVTIRDALRYGTGNAILTIDNDNAVVTNVTISGARWNNNYDGGRRAVWIKKGLLVDSVVKETAVAGEVNGAGVMLDGGEMRGCAVTGCFVKHGNSKGAGVFVGKNALVDRCVISGNIANKTWVTEGGWVDPAGTPMGTASGEGAGVYLAGGTLRNSLVTGNVGAENGGGVYLASGTVENCTIVANTSTIAVNNTDEKNKPKGNETVAGVYIAGGSLVNSIVWDNVNTNGVKDVIFAEETEGTVKRCCFSEADNTNGNISADPLFTDAANGDYTLTETSPCVDKGKRLDWFTGAVDLAGNARVRGNRVDLGCYESEYSRPVGFIILVK